MDEAVAGHANRIELELHADDSVTVRDNGRGIPVDPHPKFPDKSALEVILCTLHAGGKFNGKAYDTSGGLNGVGSSVVNALSDRMYRRGRPEQGTLRTKLLARHPARPDPETRRRSRTGAAPRHLPPRPRDLRPPDPSDPPACCRWSRSKAYLFSGVEIRWKSAIPDGDTPQEATFHFPGGLADYLADTLEKVTTYADRPFAGHVSFQEKYQHPRLGRMGDQLDPGARRLPPLLLQHRPHPRRRHA